jgi:hypothetical protein
MSELKQGSGFANPDAAYRMIVEAHRGLTDAQSTALDACLVLILANQVGSLAVLREALQLARETAIGDQPAAGPPIR